MAKNDFKH